LAALVAACAGVNLLSSRVDYTTRIRMAEHSTTVRNVAALNVARVGRVEATDDALLPFRLLDGGMSRYLRSPSFCTTCSPTTRARRRYARTPTSCWPGSRRDRAHPVLGHQCPAAGLAAGEPVQLLVQRVQLALQGVGDAQRHAHRLASRRRQALPGFQPGSAFPGGQRGVDDRHAVVERVAWIRCTQAVCSSRRSW
jgi:hypothetical protein